jgi:hypothetical protein
VADPAVVDNVDDQTGARLGTNSTATSVQTLRPRWCQSSDL